jgi:hypothetical protein
MGSPASRDDRDVLGDVAALRYVKKAYRGPERAVRAAELASIFMDDVAFPGREVIREGPIKKVGRRSCCSMGSATPHQQSLRGGLQISRDGPERVQLFLLSDSIVYADVPVLSNSDNKYKLRREVRLDQLVAR